MAFPYALVAQGVGLVASLFNRGGGMSAAMQLEIVRQLGLVNQNLFEQSKILHEVVKTLNQLSEKEAKFQIQQQSLKETEKISDLFRRLSPAIGFVDDIDDVFQEFVNVFERLKDLLDDIEPMSKSLSSHTLSLVDFSQPIMSTINNLLIVSDIVYEPTSIIAYANKDKL